MKESTAADLLRKLGCIISMGTGQLLVTIPSWRLDLTMEADLLEEIARLHGYDQIPTRNPAIRLTTVPDDRLWSFERKVATLLAGLGYSEACNSSFLSLKQVASFVPAPRPKAGQPTHSRRQPAFAGTSRSADEPSARLFCKAVCSIFIAKMPASNSLKRAAFFFRTRKAGMKPGAYRCSSRAIFKPRIGAEKKRKPITTTSPGLVEALFKALHIPNINSCPGGLRPFHPKRCSVIMSGPAMLGWMGEIHPDLNQELDTTEPLIAAELDTQALLEAAPEQMAYTFRSALFRRCAAIFRWWRPIDAL